uniref:hypothetical protein n=1 Tax=Coprococcus sp. TaxID=2049024 RepID=UPI004026B547
MTQEWKNRFLGFMEGTKTLPLTYDPFFKKLFNPDIYPERLSSLISSIIGTKVTVQCILSNEDSMLAYTHLLLSKFGYKNTLPVFTSRADIELFTCKGPPR